MDTSTLLTGLLFGAIGTGYLVYGKRQQHPIALLAGVLLCGMPYFITNVVLLFLASLVAMALPWLIRY
jgi:hypothetical protein